MEVEEGNTWQEWLTVPHPLRPSLCSPHFLHAHPPPPLLSARLKHRNTEFEYREVSLWIKLFYDDVLLSFPWYCRTHIYFPIFPILLSWCFLIFFLVRPNFASIFCLSAFWFWHQPDLWNGNELFFCASDLIICHHFMNRNTCAVNISSTRCVINCIEIVFNYTLNSSAISLKQVFFWI